MLKVNEDISGLDDPGKVLKRGTPRSRLLPTIFDMLRWEVVDKSKWLVADHINLGESRAVARLFRRLAAAREWHGAVIVNYPYRYAHDRPLPGVSLLSLFTAAKALMTVRSPLFPAAPLAAKY